MENTTGFVLNDAIERWRTGLQEKPALRHNDVAELESHLIDSVNRLQAQGLSAEEAFLVASERLGSGWQLESEFAKTNPQRVWLDRAFWMVFGILLLDCLRWSAIPATNVARNLAWTAGLNAHWISVVSLVALAVVFGGGLAICGWLAIHHGPWVARLGGRCLRRPLLLGLALILLLHSLYPLTRWLSGRLIDTLGVVGPFPQIQNQIPILEAWELWSMHVQDLLWVAVLPLLAGFLWRMRQREQAQPWSSSLDQLDPHGREIAQSLHAQGLSDPEAAFLASRRCGLSAAAESAPGRVSARLVWLEHALWVVCGQVLMILEMYYNPITPFWLFVVWAQKHGISDHLTGPVLVTLSLAIDVALVVALWRFVTKYQMQSNWVGHWCCQRPMLTALALILLYVGLSGGIRGARLIPGLTGHTIGEWAYYRGLLLSLYLPVSLFLWLAKQRMKPVAAH